MNKENREHLLKSIQKSVENTKTCTYQRSGEQPISQDSFYCETCWPEDQTLSCCQACSIICHKGHTVQKKDKSIFACNCGDNMRCLAPTDPLKKMFNAAEEGDLDVVESSLKKGLSVNTQIYSTLIKESLSTLLHIAAYRQDQKLLSLLASMKANAGLQDYSGRTPLHTLLLKIKNIIKSKEREILTLDLATVTTFIKDFKSYLDMTDEDLNTPIHIASQIYWGDKTSALELLISKSDLTMKNKQQETAIGLAISEVIPENVIALLRAKSPIDLHLVLRACEEEHLIPPMLKERSDITKFRDDHDNYTLMCAWKASLRTKHSSYHEDLEALIKYTDKYLINEANREGEYVLDLAVVNNCEFCTRLLLEAKADPNKSLSLFYATSPQIVNILLEYKADPNQVNKYGRSPLLSLINDQCIVDTKIVDHFVKYKADINIADKDKHTPLMATCEHSNTEEAITMVKKLLSCKADVEAKNKKGLTALHIAATEGDPTIVSYLLKQGANPNSLSTENSTPLILAAQEANEDVIKTLLNKKGDLTIKDDLGTTPLYAAVQSNVFNAVNMILSLPSAVDTIDEPNHEGMTPLMAALDNYPDDAPGSDENHQSLSIISLLLEKGASVYEVDNDGHDAIWYAVQYHATLSTFIPKINQVFIELQNMDSDEARAASQSIKLKALTSAVMEENEESVKFLLEKSKIDPLGNNGKAFIEAVNNDNVNILSLLYNHCRNLFPIELDKFVQKCDDENRSLLIIAAINGATKCSKLIIEKRPHDICKYYDNYYNYPLHHAAMNGNVEICKLLVNESDTTVLATNKDKMTPFALACDYGNIDAATYLLHNTIQESNIETKDNNLCTPLIVAAKKDDLRMVEFLLKNSANTLARDDCNNSPMMLACMNGNIDMTEALISYVRNKGDFMNEVFLPSESEWLIVGDCEVIKVPSSEITEKEKEKDLDLELSNMSDKYLCLHARNPWHSVLFAVETQRHEILKHLVINFSNMVQDIQENPNLNSPLDYWIRQGNLKVVTFLISKGTLHEPIRKCLELSHDFIKLAKTFPLEKQRYLLASQHFDKMAVDLFNQIESDHLAAWVLEYVCPKTKKQKDVIEKEEGIDDDDEISKFSVLGTALNTNNITFIASPRVVRIANFWWCDSWKNRNIAEFGDALPEESQSLIPLLWSKPYAFMQIPKIQFITESFCFMVFLLLFSWMAAAHIDIQSDWHPIEFALVIYAGAYLIAEIAEMRNFSVYAKDLWNILDLSIIFSIIMIVVARASYKSQDTIDWIAFDGFYAFFVVWGMILMSMRAFCIFSLSPTFGPLLSVLFGMIKDIAQFLVLMIIIVYGFFFAFLFLMGKTAVTDWNSSRKVMLSLTLGAIAGEVNMDGFPNLSAPREVLGEIMTTVYLITAGIILINLLIALMASTYENIRNKAQQVYISNLVKTVVKYDSATFHLPSPVNIFVFLFRIIIRFIRKIIPFNDTCCEFCGALCNDIHVSSCKNKDSSDGTSECNERCKLGCRLDIWEFSNFQMQTSLMFSPFDLKRIPQGKVCIECYRLIRKPAHRSDVLISFIMFCFVLGPVLLWLLVEETFRTIIGFFYAKRGLNKVSESEKAHLDEICKTLQFQGQIKRENRDQAAQAEANRVQHKEATQETPQIEPDALLTLTNKIESIFSVLKENERAKTTPVVTGLENIPHKMDDLTTKLKEMSRIQKEVLRNSQKPTIDLLTEETPPSEEEAKSWWWLW